MKENKIIHGFMLKQTKIINELDAKMHIMEYQKNGAELLWIERKEKNKTFSISYKTTPEDDTGVFHILEHSVLNGSKKYPVKEPFVELLKGSLNTFLNAMTFSDKTMYPVSSMNEKDFLNLVDVYMDAVLNPIIYEKPEIFWQEGWHYEYFGQKDEAPTYKGVVYNEMKGVYSSVDAIVESELNKLLYPDTCYGKESGGRPDSIPDLTYEQFINAHKKFYHPSNAKIILDGEMDIEKVLSLLDSYLCAYEKQKGHFPIEMQKPIAYIEKTKEFEVPANSSTEGKFQFATGYVVGKYDEQEKIYALNILFDYLCSSNESPLKKAIVSTGLAEEIEMGFIDDHAKQISAVIHVKNFKSENFEKIKNAIDSTLLNIIQKGLDKEQLVASFNSYEFRKRERDFGTYPAGVYYSMYVLKSWLHDNDPALYLTFENTFSALRKKLNTNYFENLISELFIKNKHKAAVFMKPSKTLGEEKAKLEKEKLLKIKESWSINEEQEIISLNEKLKVYQNSIDSQENLDKIPTISIDDIEKEPIKLPLEEKSIDGTKILYHNINTSGILYSNLYFSANGLNAYELSCAAFLAEILTEIGTKNLDAYELNKQIKTNIGSLFVIPEVFAKRNETDNCQAFLTISCNFLEKNKDKAIEILDEIINHAIFENKQLILDFIRQIKLKLEQDIVSAGHIFAFTRVNSYISAEGAVKEYLTGFEYYNWLKEIEKNFDTKYDELRNQLYSLKEKIFTRENLIISITGEFDEDYAVRIINKTRKSGIKKQKNIIRPTGVKQEGIIVPAEISFASCGSNLYKVDSDFNGSLMVAAKILSLDYLWNSIRVKGGAYGAGILVKYDGLAAYYSYRDPNANSSLEVYSKADEFIESFSKNADKNTIEKFIIGTISSSEPVLSNRLTGKRADINYFTEYSYEKHAEVRKQILSTTNKDLADIAKTLKSVSDENAICVIGSNEIIKSCKDKLSSILNM